MDHIIGILTLIVPFISMFVFFGWLYKEEKRREQLRIQRNEEWKKEIQSLRDNAKELKNHLANKKIILVDLGGKTPQEQIKYIELVREQLNED